MKDRESLEKTFADISLLYELALAVGESLDLRTNCDRFLKTLMARKDLAYVSVWIKREYLSEHADDEDVRAAELVYANPEFRVGRTAVPLDHPMFALLGERKAFSVPSTDQAFHDLTTETDVQKGVWAILALGELGVLKLLCMTRSRPFDEVELNQLQNVVSKFTVSIEGCLNHEDVVQEMARRKQAEEARRESEARSRAILNALPDLMFELSTDGVFLDYHAPQVEDLAVSPDEFLGRRVEDVLPLDIADGIVRCLAALLETGEPQIYEYELATRGGDECHFEARLVTSEKGTVFTIVRNVTERKEAEAALLRSQQQLVQSQKLEALGRLAGGIAHDFNNLLTTILGYSRLTLDRLTPGDPLSEDMEEIVRAGERAVDLTSQLLSFGRRKTGHPRPVDINSVVTETDRLLRRTLGEDVEIVTILGERLGGVMADPSQLQQVIMNLAINARDAMPNGGKLTIETSRVSLDETFCRSRAGLEPGDFVRLLVRDTGCGMPASVLEHVFEPFFTTKERGKGSGLGLSTVYGIVQQSGGWIEIYSEVDKGSAVSVYFRRHEDMAAELMPPRRVPELPRGSETILVVEDEESVRHFTVKILESLGYDVLQAGNGGEALLVFEMHKGPLDLVLSDVVMPLMNGRELVRRLRETGQRFKVLYTSGFSEDVFSDRGSPPEGVPVLPKPYVRETLARMVREVLDSPQPADTA